MPPVVILKQFLTDWAADIEEKQRRLTQNFIRANLIQQKPLACENLD